MRKYIIGATDVKLITLGLTLYRETTVETARRFLSGYNVSLELKQAIHKEVEVVENLLKMMNLESEFVLSEPDEETIKILQSGCRIFAAVFEEVKKRLSERVGELESREIDYLEKKLKALLESPIFTEA